VTAPQLPAGWGPQAPPAQPQYAPPAQQPYPPQQFAQPGYPQQMTPGYPPAGPVQYDPYAQFQGQPQAPAGPAPRTGTLADYSNQPEAGASFWKFKNPGDTNVGVVTRDLVDTDTKERTFKNQVQKRFDGSPDWVLSIPLTNPDGSAAVWEVGGKDRTALKNAMIAAGEPDGLPKKGWAIRATFTHYQASNNGGQASRIKEVQVAPPNGQPLPQAAPPQQPQAPAPAQTPAHGHVNQDPQYAAWLASQSQQPQAAPAPQQYQGPEAYVQPNSGQVPPPVQYQQQPQAAPAPQQFAGMPQAAAAQFQAMLGGAQPPAQG
jgi:hypothetical protein